MLLKEAADAVPTYMLVLEEEAVDSSAPVDQRTPCGLVSYRVVCQCREV
jgi:hypothetical protein